MACFTSTINFPPPVGSYFKTKIDLPPINDSGNNLEKKCDEEGVVPNKESLFHFSVSRVLSYCVKLSSFHK
jgi:hypothetical protein